MDINQGVDGIRSSQVRVQQLKKIIIFFKDMIQVSDFTDNIFQAYKEEHDEQYKHYKKEFDNYVLIPSGRDVKSSKNELRAVMERSEERISKTFNLSLEFPNEFAEMLTLSKTAFYSSV